MHCKVGTFFLILVGIQPSLILSIKNRGKWVTGGFTDGLKSFCNSRGWEGEVT